MKTHEKLDEAHKSFRQGDVSRAIAFLLEVEKEIQDITKISYFVPLHANLGSLMIDIGAFTRDKDLIMRGTYHTEYPIETKPESEISVGQYYNLANGYLALWELEKTVLLDRGKISENYLKAKKYFRKSLDLTKTDPSYGYRNLQAQINTNFGNCLCSVGRRIEAFTHYENALKYNNKFGMALGNKAIELQRLAFLAHGHTHLFLLESRRLYQEALKYTSQDDAGALQAFQSGYDAVNSFIQRHKEMKQEIHSNTESISEFHKFSRDFCIKHQLYLTPSTFVGKKEEVVFGDPMFISKFIEKIDEAHLVNQHITFLNQIKQDFVLARYLLIQSQYRSGVVDSIDKDVILFDPLEYSLHNAYIEFLKLSLKLTMDTFDKIAQFLREYCGIKNPPAKRTYFRSIWTQGKCKDTLRSEFVMRKNVFLFALFDLSMDLQDDGYYREIYECRHASTHRFLIVHDIITPSNQSGVTSRISREDLFEKTITAMQLLRAAIMYLILFVDSEEKKKQQSGKRFGTLPLYRVSCDHQWRPHIGEIY